MYMIHVYTCMSIIAMLHYVLMYNGGIEELSMLSIPKSAFRFTIIFQWFNREVCTCIITVGITKRKKAQTLDSIAIHVYTC